MPNLTVTGFIDRFMDADKPLEALGIISQVIGTAGENINQEQSIYVDPVTEEFKLTNANDITKCKGLVGLAVSTATSGNLISGQFFGAYYPTGGYLAADGEYFLSTGDGLLSLSTPTGNNNVLRPIGYTFSPTAFFIHPDPTYVTIGNGVIKPVGDYSVSSIISGKAPRAGCARPCVDCPRLRP